MLLYNVKLAKYSLIENPSFQSQYYDYNGGTLSVWMATTPFLEKILSYTSVFEQKGNIYSYVI